MATDVYVVTETCTVNGEIYHRGSRVPKGHPALKGREALSEPAPKDDVPKGGGRRPVE